MIPILLAASVLGALAYLAAVTGVAVVRAVRSGGRRDEAVGDHEALAGSRFTIPVSLIVPVGDGNPSAASATIAALLQLNYPEFELIAVADADASLDALKTTWELLPHEFFYRQSLPTKPLRRISRSSRDPRMLLVEKEAGGRADAINCWMNIARYRYAAVVNPGIRVDADALLRAMAAPLRDPGRVVAASSHVEAMSDLFEALASVRSLMESRLVWSEISGGIGPDNRVVVWRRDAILQRGGFSHDAIDPELELMASLHTFAAEGEGAPPAVVRTPAVFGATDASPAVATRYGAALEAMRVLRRRSSGPALRWLVASHVVTPLGQAWMVFGTALAAAAGWLPWRDVALALVAVCFGQALVTTAALLVRGAAPGAPDERTVRWLLLLAPLEPIVRGPMTLAARLGAAAFSAPRSRH